MAEDWSIDVRKYAPDADAGVIAGIVRHCGIALQSRDASLVSFSDKTETARVRENFLKKKLGLTESDADLDAAIADVGERMKEDRTKNRVTVYYLLAERFGKLGLFVKPGAAETTPASDESKDESKGAGIAALGAAGIAAGTSAVESAGSGLSSAAGAVAGGAAALGAGAAAAGASAVESAESGLRSVAGKVSGGATAAARAPEALIGNTTSGTGSSVWRWLLPLLIALALLGLLYWFLHRPATVPPTDSTQASAPAATAPDTSATTPVAPVDNSASATTPAIPEGAGVTTETRDGKPVVKVYFDTGKADVVEAFGPAAASLKSYLDANPGNTLTVSGFNDKTGNAAANAILSKNRAKAVQAALVAANIPADAIELTKPADTTDTSTSNAEARRVEVAIK